VIDVERQGRGLTVWGQLGEVLVAERRADRPVPLLAGTGAIDHGGSCRVQGLACGTVFDLY